ncbi:MAG: ATP-binding protein [Polyangiaceae bacterium]
MSQVHPSRLAFQAARSILAAVHDFDLQIQGTSVHVTHRASLDYDLSDVAEKQIAGLDKDVDGPWPSTIRVDCEWRGGRVLLDVRLNVWRQKGPYHGHLALQIVTFPSNREIVWINLTKRIDDAQQAERSTCAIPANFALWTRPGERSARPLTEALTKAAASAGLASSGATQFHVFDLVLPSGEVSPEAPEVFERLIKTALLKLPFVTRGEKSDVDGSPPFDIQAARQKAAEEAPALAPVVAAAKEPLAAVRAPSDPEASLSSQENVFYDYFDCQFFGPFRSFEWSQLAKINLLVGENDTGKSHLLKLMYALARGVEEYTLGRSSDQPPWGKVLTEKLIWTFEPEGGKLGKLVHRPVETALSVMATLCNEEYEFAFGSETSSDPKDFGGVSREIRPQPGLHALFLPPKEVLTSLNAITMVRERRMFGFDDTYVDLAKALRLEAIQDVLPPEMQTVLDNLDKMLGGRLITEQGRFYFERGEERFGMSHTAEGIKKIGILARLIQNGELRRNSILFLDEPEVNLHPSWSRALVQMLFDLSRAGVQIFAATHSHFVLKEMELFARERREPVMLCSLSKSESRIDASYHDLQEGVPETGIERAALAQYDDDVMLGWNGKR